VLNQQSIVLAYLIQTRVLLCPNMFDLHMTFALQLQLLHAIAQGVDTCDKQLFLYQVTVAI
jgi:hypothetical protein